MDSHDRTSGHEGRSCGASKCAHRQGARRSGVESAYQELGATPWPTSPAEIKAFRDSEEVRLLPIMKTAGIKPE